MVKTFQELPTWRNSVNFNKINFWLTKFEKWDARNNGISNIWNNSRVLKLMPVYWKEYLDI